MTLVEDCRAALMTAKTKLEIDETVVAICKKYGGKHNVPVEVRNIIAVARAELQGRAVG